MTVITIAAIYAATSYEPLLLLCLLLQIQVLQQLLPFLRLDGYYVLSDLVGVPDLFRRIGPVLRSVIPFRDPEPSVTELKPWVRRVVIGWVFVLVPVLAANLGYFLLAAPRIAATSWDSASHFVGTMTTAGGAAAVWAATQLVLLLLPTIGAAYTFIRVARRGSVGAWRWSSGSPPRRLAVVTGGLGMAALLAVTWYPDARLSPYRDGERGTLQQHARELRSAGTGSPLLRSPRAALEPLPPYEDRSRGNSDRSSGGADPAAPTRDKNSSPTSSPATPTASDSATPTSNGSSHSATARSSPTSPSAGATSSPASNTTSTRSNQSTSTRNGAAEPTSSGSSTPTSTRNTDSQGPTSSAPSTQTTTRSSDPDDATSSPSGTSTSTRSR
jgi:putative peptide zinc metalloprotease protein